MNVALLTSLIIVAAILCGGVHSSCTNLQAPVPLHGDINLARGAVELRFDISVVPRWWEETLTSAHVPLSRTFDVIIPTYIYVDGIEPYKTTLQYVRTIASNGSYILSVHIENQRKLLPTPQYGSESGVFVVQMPLNATSLCPLTLAYVSTSSPPTEFSTLATYSVAAIPGATPPPPQETPAPTAAVELTNGQFLTKGTVSISSIVGMVLAPTIATDVQSLVVLSLVNCTKALQPQIAETLNVPRLLSPAALPDTEPMGMIQGNTLLVISVFATHLTGVFIFKKVRGVETFGDAASRVFFPTVPINVAKATFPGTMVAAVVSSYDGDTEFEKAIGAMFLICCLGFVVFLPLFATHFLLDVAVYKIFKLEGTLAPKEQKQVDAIPKGVRFYAARGKWYGSATRSMYGSLFTWIGRPEPMWVSLPFIVPCICTLGVIPYRNTIDGCEGTMIGLGAILFTVSITVGALNVHRSSIGNLLAAASCALVGVVMLTIVVGNSTASLVAIQILLAVQIARIVNTILIYFSERRVMTEGNVPTRAVWAWSGARHLRTEGSFRASDPLSMSADPAATDTSHCQCEGCSETGLTKFLQLVLASSTTRCVRQLKTLTRHLALVERKRQQSVHGHTSFAESLINEIQDDIEEEEAIRHVRSVSSPPGVDGRGGEQGSSIHDRHLSLLNAPTNEMEVAAAEEELPEVDPAYYDQQEATDGDADPFATLDSILDDSSEDDDSFLEPPPIVVDPYEAEKQAFLEGATVEAEDGSQAYVTFATGECCVQIETIFGDNILDPCKLYNPSTLRSVRSGALYMRSEKQIQPSRSSAVLKQLLEDDIL